MSFDVSYVNPGNFEGWEEYVPKYDRERTVLAVQINLPEGFLFHATLPYVECGLIGEQYVTLPGKQGDWVVYDELQSPYTNVIPYSNAHFRDCFEKKDDMKNESE